MIFIERDRENSENWKVNYWSWKGDGKGVVGQVVLKRKSIKEDADAEGLVPIDVFLSHLDFWRKALFGDDVKSFYLEAGCHVFMSPEYYKLDLKEEELQRLRRLFKQYEDSYESSDYEMCEKLLKEAKKVFDRAKGKDVKFADEKRREDDVVGIEFEVQPRGRSGDSEMGKQVGEEGQRQWVDFIHDLFSASRSAVLSEETNRNSSQRRERKV